MRRIAITLLVPDGIDIFDLHERIQEGDFDEGYAADADLSVYETVDDLTKHLTLVQLAEGWLDAADDLDATIPEDYDSAEDEANAAIVTQLHEDAHALLDAIGVLDRESSASRQHYIDTGRYLRLDKED